MTITLSLVMVIGDNKIDNANKCRHIAGNFDGRVDTAG